MSSSEIFNNFLRTVIQLTGAETASLFINSDSTGKPFIMLASDGTNEPIPELENRISTSEVVSRIMRATHKKNPLDYAATVETFPGSLTNSFLIHIPMSNQLSEQSIRGHSPVSSERRKSEFGKQQYQVTQSIWIELTFNDDFDTNLVQQLDTITLSSSTPDSQMEWLVHSLVVGAQTVWETSRLSLLMRDPISQLGGRAEFQAQLKRVFNQAEIHDQSLSLMLINPDDFGSINQRFDQQSGDLALAEIASKLRGSLRSTDTVYRYGGAIFALVLTQTNLEEATGACERISNLMTGPYLNGALRLAFSFGLAVYDKNTKNDEHADENDLLRQADHALNLAKIAGGGRVTVWDSDDLNEPIDNLDRLSGIFTANTEKDYRNMLLLWDTIAIVSSGEDTPVIANEFVERIQSTLKPDKVWLFSNHDENFLLLADSMAKDNNHEMENGHAIPELSKQQTNLLAEVKKQLHTEQAVLSVTKEDNGTNKDIAAYAVPLVARDQYMGCLYLEGHVNKLSLDSSDLIFLNALASQIALVLDRAELAMHWKQQKELESKLLREEVKELRDQVFNQSLSESRLIYQSPEMQSILDTLDAVAATDVTVLVTGESGTGKEMLARMIHDKSTRRDKPLVTVDCSAIAHSLMETELFGYVKGAYTGATGVSEGRIEQADGGTLFLDEIGEIPLEVQAKLLRFVQEKEISQVGATQTRIVDVRIVAVTNRDLAREVAEGRFRGDLYYRLKVVTLTSPALRDRAGDIIPLAHHFIDKFAHQYEKGTRKLTTGAEDFLKSYSWPGNVRELQNCILRAIVLSKSENIDVDNIQLMNEEADTIMSPTTPYLESESAQESSNNIPVGGVKPISNGQSNIPNTKTTDPWQALNQSLTRQVCLSIDDNAVISFPLGQWLTEDLVLIADNSANNVSRRASAKLGVAETTYRRQLEKVKRANLMGTLVRTPSWAEMKPVLSALIASPDNEDGKNILDASKQILLSVIAAHVNNDITLGSALMGVTRLTYQRWINLQSEHVQAT